MGTLAKQIESILNSHSAENGSDTPDFILAEYLLGCLKAFDDATNKREQWYGQDNVRYGQDAITGKPVPPLIAPIRARCIYYNERKPTRGRPVKTKKRT